MNEEIRARENCSTPNNTLPEPQDKDGKNEFFDFSRDVPYSGSALYLVSIQAESFMCFLSFTPLVG